jgi:hypothetical protein
MASDQGVCPAEVELLFQTKTVAEVREVRNVTRELEITSVAHCCCFLVCALPNQRRAARSPAG